MVLRRLHHRDQDHPHRPLRRIQLQLILPDRRLIHRHRRVIFIREHLCLLRHNRRNLQFRLDRLDLRPQRGKYTLPIDNRTE